MRLRPPYESEKALLGCLLLQPELIVDAPEILMPHDFYYEEHQQIFNAMLVLFEKHQCFDIHMMVDYLPDSFIHNNVTRAFDEYLYHLANECCSTHNLKSHAAIIREKSVQRQLVEIAKEVEEQTKNPEQSPEEIMDSVEKRVLQLKEQYDL